MDVRLVLRNLTWIDLAVAAWVVFCVVLAVAIANQVSRLDRYGTTIDQSAQALDEIAGALETIGGVPLIGDDVGDIASEVRITAQRMRESASDTRSAAGNLSVLLGLAVGIIPTAPLLALYLPQRARQIRENSRLVRNLRRDRGVEFTRNYLAHRALSEMNYEALRGMGQDPWGQVRQGRVDRLAVEELRRLGLDEEAARLARDEEVNR